MTRRRRNITVAAIGLTILVGLAVYALVCMPFSALVFGMGDGSPAYAEKWRGRLEPLIDPETARSAYQEIEVQRFANGEWVIGVSADSHSSHWGGTVVVKDSTGQVHAFFGHVCGPRFLSRLSTSTSLADFYGHEEWRHWKLREYQYP